MKKIEVSDQMNSKAAATIAAEIAKITANYPADCGTVGSTLGMTKREAQAQSIALYFVTNVYRIAPADDGSEGEAERAALVKTIADAAIAITGK